ncbi:UNVERIFIED_CONTAM: Nucleolar complex protein 2 [Sesamum radiatum]|uniref:Nucleolar complex protein 2 n=1 Tax=Sesamum radiatum TaxID=300843 RepID=A0AAW2UT83_SESRA
MGSKNKAKKLKEESEVKKSAGMEKKEAKEHIGTLRKLQEVLITACVMYVQDPEFYEFLKEHDNELLEFDEEDLDDDVQTDVEEEEETDVDNVEHSDGEAEAEKEEEPPRNVITSAMVDSWCNEIRDGAKLGAVRSLLRAFRSACHYGDDGGDDPTAKFSTMSSSVFNKIMLFVLNEMDGILRGLLNLPPSGGKKEMVIDLMTTRRWKNYNHLVKSYLGNSLHVLNQMTDNEMIAFMLRRLKYSSVFLAAFPALLRKYIKVALHFWGTGSGALPVVSFLFLRDSCIRLGSDCLDDCIKGMYKAYVLNCQFVNSTKLQHLQFLSKGKEEPSSSKKEKGKEAPSSSAKKETFRKVYQWKYINCLELWTGVVSAYSSETELAPLAYPLTQIITGVARLVPSACYFPLRLRCVRMLSRISAATGTFIPVSLLLLDMLEIKELRKPPTGGAGKAVNLFSILKVSKSTLKTRAFQEACVFSVVEELTEHLAQWSYSIAFMELSFVPSVRLRNFCKSTKVERFRREMRRLIRQIEANTDFINKKRTKISFLPNDPAAASFLEDEKKSGASPLSQYAVTLRQRAQERNDALMESSVLVGDHSSEFGNEITSDDEYDSSENEESDGRLVPGQDSKLTHQKDVKKKKKKNIEPPEETAFDQDIIEDFVLSSDEDDNPVSGTLEEEDSEPEAATPAQRNKKRKQPMEMSKDKAKLRNSKPKKRKKKAQGKL